MLEEDIHRDVNKELFVPKLNRGVSQQGASAGVSGLRELRTQQLPLRQETHHHLEVLLPERHRRHQTRELHFPEALPGRGRHR